MSKPSDDETRESLASEQDGAHDRVRAQFGKTAAAYVASQGHARGKDLAAMVQLAGELSGRDVLDVATGGGHTALAFARAGAEVTATDLTPEMLTAAERFIRGQPDAASLSVAFSPASAEALPFAARSFDFVLCRIAAHHFADPERFVAEAARVLRPGGSLMLVDNVAPEDPALGEAMNRIERERDPSHAQAYTVGTWVGWLAGAGLDLYRLERWTTPKLYREWLARAQTPREAGDALEAYVLSLPKAFRSYFGVLEEDGRLRSLSHEAALLAARRDVRLDR